MGYQYEIRQLEQVLKPILQENTSISRSTIKCLTQPGDNYGSLMLAVDVTVRNGKTEERTMHMVAKMCPPNKWLRKMFNTPITFKKEESLYKQISVTLKQFEEECGLSHMTDFFPNYYGSRLSLDPNSKEVDDDAVLLLENLKVQGYEVGNRLEGFDLQTSKAILRALATFHAVPLALKLKKPDVFAEKLLPNIGKMKGFDEFTEEQRQQALNVLMDAIKKHEEFLPYVDRIREYYRQGEKVFQEGPEPREPFATVGHSDFWVNNILINKKDSDEIKVKFVDFQIVDYGSPARDLIFFLYLSVQNEIVAQHSDELIQLYYNTFIGTLEKFGCNTEQFSFAEFEKDLQYETKASQVFHCLSMAIPLFTKKGVIKPMEEFEADDMYNSELADEFEPKIELIISSFIKNKWL